MGLRCDVAVVGGGHNALVAATFLARAGLDVRLFERARVPGGACRTEYPFTKAPQLGCSTGAYLLGLMPPELMARLGIEVEILRRDPHYFLPTRDGRYLLFGSNRGDVERQIRTFFSEADARAQAALEETLAGLREDVARSWLEPPRSLEETAERYVRPELRERFLTLCRGAIGPWLESFGFASDLLVAMYAVTDGFTGLYGGWNDPGTGMNFLIHNMCRLPGSGGTWMVVKGGMGALTEALVRALREAGGHLVLGAEVAKIDVQGGAVTGLELADGRRVEAPVVLSGTDPFTLRRLLGPGVLSDAFEARLERLRAPGSSFKLNLALSDLPTFRCLPDPRGQHRGTIHLLPEEGTVRETLEAAWAAARAGRLPERPAIEWYIHTATDSSLMDGAGRHSAALFVQWVPYEIEGGGWEEAEAPFAERLLSICDEFAPDTSAKVVDLFPLSPKGIEAHFGMRYGHIHHVDNRFGFDERIPYRLPVGGLYACGAGCHPGGSVIGAAGHNAAREVLDDLGRPSDSLVPAPAPSGGAA
ncbi:MAG: NAD(P)/FAD-dependent oxidoreductase [Deltaproteobacteria bacterium]|nr:MAG: NAD(P)/FAD-dependent oxidoreductase [Deltaproteobacteria bacterium]